MESSIEIGEEDANITRFRRRNKMLILCLVFLMISLALALTALITHLVRIDIRENPPLHNPAFNRALEAFCFVNSDPPACLRTLNPKTAGKFVSDPNQIFTISLQSAAEGVQNSIDSLTIAGELVFGNCSDRLQHALDQLRDPIDAMLADPFVESRSDEQRGVIMTRIMAAEEDVETCLEDLDRIGGGGDAAALGEVKAYLNGAGDFLIGYAEVLQMFEADRGAYQSQGRMIFFYEPGINIVGMCGAQLFFLICLFCSLFRIKSRRNF